MFGWARHLARLFTIARILARHDLIRPLADIAGLPRGFLPLSSMFADRGRAGLRAGERWTQAAQDLGPTFIKLGQSLATRPDLVGGDLARDLASLQDRVPPFPAALARRVIEEDLDQPIDQIFSTFDDVPIAAASIAQVHFARTTDGRDVAVKVLRPGIVEQFGRDLDLFAWLADLAERLMPSTRRLKPREVAKTVRDSIALEVDLRFEAAAGSELAANFVGDDGFRVPEVDWARTGKRCATFERVYGFRIDDQAGLSAAGYDLREVLTNAAEAFFNQVFRDGFFHADLHPGNLFVIEGGAIAPVDFGIMGRLDRRTRTYLADMLLGFLTGDYERVAQVHFDAGYVPRTQSIAAFTQACRSIGEPLLGRPLAEISLARLLAQLFEVTERFEMETQPQLLLLQKTMVLAEGVGRALDPSVNMWELARPLIERWMVEHRGPQARLRAALIALVEGADRLPGLLGLGPDGDAGGVRLHPDTIRAVADAYVDAAAQRRGVSSYVLVILGLACGLIAGLLL